MTDFNVEKFNVPARITVNLITFYSYYTATGNVEICIYTEDGSTKKIDVTTAQFTPASNVLSTTTVNSVVLTPGNYYLAMGCGSVQCSILTYSWATSNVSPFNDFVPSGKYPYEGIYTMTSAAGHGCDSTINPANMTYTTNDSTVVRLDM